MAEKEYQASSAIDNSGILDDVLENTPPEQRKKIEQMMISSFQM